MKQQARGRIDERIVAVGKAGYPLYLVQGETRNLAIDAGVNLLGPRYLNSIRDIFGEAGGPDYLFLTHSHYDHLGAAPYLKRHLPDLKVGAHERLAGLLQKPSVLDTMNQLSASHAELRKYNVDGEDVALRPIEIDIPLKAGDCFDLGELTCTVYETPGHTRDSLSFYLPELGALFPGDACGVPEGRGGDKVLVQFLSSYQDYVASITEIIALQPEILCLGHGWVFAGEDAADYLRRSLVETFRYRELIESYLGAAGGDAEQAIQKMVRAEYDEQGDLYQERMAYLANLTAQVKHIAGLR
jgi:glyoxylase-like metal-dependent hydrolase (beta-lactamase superfamily II)